MYSIPQQLRFSTIIATLLIIMLMSAMPLISRADTPAQDMPTFYVYLAGPEVFLQEPIKAGNAKKALIESLAKEHNWPFKLVGLYPLDNSIPDFKNDFSTGMRIYHANLALMQKADFIAANMVRFRGPSMDVGTAFEMGYMAGLDKTVFAYYEAEPFYGQPEKPELLAERVKKYWQVDPNNNTMDIDGIHIEQFAMVDNLMMIGAQHETGYDIALTFEQAILNIADFILAKQ